MSLILVIDDEGPLRRALRTSLTARSYEVAEAGGGTAGVVATADRSPDLVILDLGLPDIDGMEALRRIRSFSQVPVIVLSARDRQSDKVQALEHGADDYITKPFDPNELLARVQAILRRRNAEAPPAVTRLRFGSLEIDLARRLVTSDGETVQLTKTERRLLELLVTNPGRLMTQDVILREVWGPGYQTQTNYLRTYIGQLRKKLGDSASNPHLILTEPGIGYRWIADEHA
jgi:two-component system KDP operon response regulator KdpE